MLGQPRAIAFGRQPQQQKHVLEVDLTPSWLHRIVSDQCHGRSGLSPKNKHPPGDRHALHLRAIRDRQQKNEQIENQKPKFK